MEILLLLALHVVALVSLFLAQMRRDARDDVLMVLFVGLCFIGLFIGLLKVDYYMENSVGMTTKTDNSSPMNVAIGTLYGLFGIGYIINNILLYSRKGQEVGP